MRKMRFFRDVCYEFMYRHLNLDIFSIWHTPHAQKRRQYVIKRGIKNLMPWLFWFFIVYSFLGLIHHCVQLLRAKFISGQPVGMWRARCFYGLRDAAIRQMRVIGSIIMVACWLMLFIGLAWNKPKCMTPWLAVMRVTLPFDFFLWGLEIIFGQEELNWHGFLNFLLPALCRFVLGFMKTVLEDTNRRRSTSH